MLHDVSLLSHQKTKQHVLRGVWNMKVGQVRIGQKSYGAMNQLLPSFNKAALVGYGENQLMNGRSFVFQP